MFVICADQIYRNKFKCFETNPKETVNQRNIRMRLVVASGGLKTAIYESKN